MRDSLRRVDHGVGLAIDGITDWALAMFAAWVVLAYLAMIAHAPVLPFLIFWLVLALPIGVLLWWLRRPAPAASSGAAEPPPDRRGLLVGLGVPFVLAAAAAYASRYAHGSRWALAWALGLFALAVGLAVELLRRRRGGNAEAAQPAEGAAEPAAPTVFPGMNILVTLAAVASGVLSLFVFRSDDDDVYYLNRAASVADFDRIPIRDMLLTHGHLKAVAGTGAPVDALAPLQGAVAHLLGQQSPTIAYLVTPFVGTILAVLALWRLVRSWAPRRAAAAFVVALAFLYYDGNTHLSFGNFFLTRMWQGKVVFVAWLIPLLLAYLTDWARRPDRRTAVLILASGVAAIGMTVSATYDFPLLIAAGLVPLVLARRWRDAVIPLAAVVFPFVIGSIASRYSPPSGLQVSNLTGAAGTFHDTVGRGALAAISGLAIWFGPRLPRDRNARFIALGASLLVTLSLTPGLLHAVGTAISVGGALRRIVWIVPVPALVGLFATVPLPELLPRRVPLLRPAAALALAVVLAGGVVAEGAGILSADSTKVLSHPAWKTYGPVRAEAQRILQRVPAGAEVLAPYGVMRAIAIVTAKVHAVDPRSYYTMLIKEPPGLQAQRVVLKHWILRTPAGIPYRRVAHSLRLLHVTDVCLPYDYKAEAQIVTHAGYHFEFSTNTLNCYAMRAPSA